MTERWPYGVAPDGYLTYLLELHKLYGKRISNVKLRPAKGIYIGKGSEWANPYRGSVTVEERVNNIYNFDMYYREQFFIEDSPLNHSNVYYTFHDTSRQLVCYCNDGTNIPNVKHLCHGLIYMASYIKAMEVTQEKELDSVFSRSNLL